MWALIAKAALSYLESHPEKVEQLLDAAVSALISHFSKPSAPAAA